MATPKESPFAVNLGEAAQSIRALRQRLRWLIRQREGTVRTGRLFVRIVNARLVRLTKPLCRRAKRRSGHMASRKLESAVPI
jgi:hypothetical protein